MNSTIELVITGILPSYISNQLDPIPQSCVMGETIMHYCIYFFFEPLHNTVIPTK